MEMPFGERLASKAKKSIPFLVLFIVLSLIWGSATHFFYERLNEWLVSNFGGYVTKTLRWAIDHPFTVILIAGLALCLGVIISALTSYSGNRKVQIVSL